MIQQMNTVTTSLGLMALLTALFGYLQWHKQTTNENEAQRGDRLRLANATVNMIGLLLWPVFWDISVGLPVLCSSPMLIIAFLWPFLVTFVQLKHEHYRTTEEGDVILPPVNVDSGVIVSIIFAMATLLVTIPKTSATSQSLLMYSLLLCVIFVVPLGHLEPSSGSADVIQATQRVCLNYSIGFIIAAIVMYLQSSKTV